MPTGSQVVPPGAVVSGYPVPPPGSVVLGGEAGQIALGLAVSPGRGKIGLQASVVGMQGPGVKGLSVRFEVHGSSGQKATVAGTGCGTGCYRTAVGIRRPLRVVVHLSGEKPVTFGMPAAWPPPPAAVIVMQAASAWRKLHTLAFHQSLGAGQVVLQTNYREVSPNRLEYTNEGNLGSEIIIGDRRWLRASGSSRWLESPQAPVHQPVPFWQSATNAYLLGTVSSGGRPAWKVSFFDFPGGPAWFTILVDKATLHTKELWMIAQVHFIHRTYHSFNGPIIITPPS
jgi:hypothetical protein